DKAEKGTIPYKEPWIGFIHSTITLWPFLQDEYLLLDDIIQSEAFYDSLDFCKGIFTLSDYLARYTRNKLNHSVKIEMLKHPTEFTSVLFNFEKFLKEKKVVHAGVWLRKVSSFYQLNATGYRKIMLLTPRLLTYLETELNYYPNLRIDFPSVEILQRLSNNEYDHLLSESVVFLDLCDSSASNTVVECLARGTPLLVNKLQPVVEYLGEEYPFYYSTLEEAGQKLSDINLINQTAKYLIQFPGREEITGEYFINAFLNSAIIKSVS
ncbi:MAG TPA: hypothetical protein VGI82_11320, partial [Chitinophagaceae bacterium]